MQLSETYIQKLVRLVERNIIIINDIKDNDYKTEVQSRLITQ